LSHSAAGRCTVSTSITTASRYTVSPPHAALLLLHTAPKGGALSLFYRCRRHHLPVAIRVGWLGRGWCFGRRGLVRAAWVPACGVGVVWRWLRVVWAPACGGVLRRVGAARKQSVRSQASGGQAQKRSVRSPSEQSQQESRPNGRRRRRRLLLPSPQRAAVCARGMLRSNEACSLCYATQPSYCPPPSFSTKTEGYVVGGGWGADG
jgi:hypothetical protein